MKEQIFAITILLLLISCQSKSDCFGGRVIVDEVKTAVKYVEWQEPQFVEFTGKNYVACNFPDTLTKNQNYSVTLKLLKVDPSEKFVGQPCEIINLEIKNNQEIESLNLNHKELFTGGGGKTDNDETITVGIYITKIAESEIKYEFTELIDWKLKRELKGNATLQKTNDDKIKTRNGEMESAFRFVDSENNIEIFITKESQINQAKSKLLEKNISKISGLMYNK